MFFCGIPHDNYHYDKVLIVKGPLFFFQANPFWFRKTTTNPHILADVNVECPVDKHPELKIYLSELVLGSYECIPTAYVTMTKMHV